MLCKLSNFTDFFLIFGGRHSFLWGHWYLCYILLMMCTLGFKARVDTSLLYFVVCVQWIAQIHHWFNTCWPLNCQHGSLAIWWLFCSICKLMLLFVISLLSFMIPRSLWCCCCCCCCLCRLWCSCHCCCCRCWYPGCGKEDNNHSSKLRKQPLLSCIISDMDYHLWHLGNLLNI